MLMMDGRSRVVRHSTRTGIWFLLVNLNNSAAYLRYCLLQCYLDLSHSYVELQILEVLSVKCNYLKPAYIITEEVKRFPA